MQVNLHENAKSLIQKFQRREAHIGVIGLGYVGLPLAVVLAESGFQVVGVDVDERKVAELVQGRSHIGDVSDPRLRPLVESRQLTFNHDYSALAEVDGVSICVPTPLRKTGDPDLTFIISAARSLAPHVRKNMAIVLESTTYPGTTRELVLPELEADGLKVGQDFFLAFSPERVDPGRQDWTTENTPKVIGGITPACTQVAVAYYGAAIESVVPVSSAEVAEMTKLLENTFRAVNIGMANEMALMCDRLGIDVWEVIEAAATKPFGFMKFSPGPGLGGHCIPIDPLYLSWKLKSMKYNARFIDLASEINTGMPRYVVSRVQDALNDQQKSLKAARILILGVAYKPDVSDTRESPAIDVIGLLQEKGAVVDYFDPHVPALDEDGLVMTCVPDMSAAVAQADCVLVITDHSGIDYQEVAQRALLVFDTRNAVRVQDDLRSKVIKL